MRRRKFYRSLRKLGACSEATAWVGRQPKRMKAREIWDDCEQPGWLLWLVVRVRLSRRAAMRLLMDAGADLLAEMPRTAAAVVARAEMEAWAYGPGALPPRPPGLSDEALLARPGWRFLSHLYEMVYTASDHLAADSAQSALDQVLYRCDAHQLCRSICTAFLWKDVRRAVVETSAVAGGVGHEPQ